MGRRKPVRITPLPSESFLPPQALVSPPRPVPLACHVGGHTATQRQTNAPPACAWLCAWLTCACGRAVLRQVGRRGAARCARPAPAPAPAVVGLRQRKLWGRVAFARRQGTAPVACIFNNTLTHTLSLSLTHIQPNTKMIMILLYYGPEAGPLAAI